MMLITDNKRRIKVTFENGDVIKTALAEYVTDREIREHYTIGTVFNIGRVEDNLQRLTKVEILK
jgi:hypothetical protein